MKKRIIEILIGLLPFIAVAGIIFLAPVGLKLIFSGIGEGTKEEIQGLNANSFNEPTLVGDIPGVGTIKMVEYRTGLNKNSADRIYFIDKSQPITANQDIKEGKTTKVQTTVFIDGIEYKPAEAVNN